jgi:predicted RNA binding protein YcfA (HicA-like mRNA interferase family)
VVKKETDAGDVGCVVPLHGELAVGTLAGILKQAGVSVADFVAKL